MKKLTPIFRKKQILHLCRKNVHFIFNGEIYIHIDGLAMGSPLGPVLHFHGWPWKDPHTKAGPEVKLWRWFIDDTICFAKMDSLKYILLTINSFQKYIKFTKEMEENSMIPFLDILLIRTPQKIHKKTS